MKNEEVGEATQECMFLRLPYCPFTPLNLFWKITLGALVVLMLVFSLTLWLMARSMDKHVGEIEKLRIEGAAQHHELSGKIEGHKQLTMDNRVVTSRIEGMLSNWISERRQGIIDTRLDLNKERTQEKHKE